MADLRKTGLKMRNDVSENLAPKFFQRERGHVPHSTTPLPPMKVRLWRIFFLPYSVTGHEWSLTY